MATVSFDKKIIIERPKEVDNFLRIYNSEEPALPISKELASEKNIDRGKELLKQYFSR